MKGFKRLRQMDVIEADDFIRVQGIAITCESLNCEPSEAQKEEARRLLKAGYGWKMVKAGEYQRGWAVGKRVKDTAEGFAAPWDVLRRKRR